MRTSALSRRAFLAVSAAGMTEAAFGTGSTLSRSALQLPSYFPIVGAPLWWQAASKGLIYGAAANHLAITDDPAFAQALVREAVMLTPTLELNWLSLRPRLSVFNFGPADAIVAFAHRHGMLLRGHALVWGDPYLTPTTLKEIKRATNVKQILETHVSTVVKRYAGRFYSWDVVNEALGPFAPGKRYTLAPRIWLQRLGPHYIDIAFHAARAADPNALLVLNDYGFEVGLPAASPRRRQDSMVNLLTDLLARGVPVGALGLEAHLNSVAMREDFNPNLYRAFLRNVAQLGLKILVTELDVSDVDETGSIMQRDRAVADAYARYLTLTLEEEAVVVVNTWGLTDRHTWIQGAQRRADKEPLRPLPLDSHLRRKQAWGAIAYSFRRAPRRRLWSPLGFPRDLPQQSGAPGGVSSSLEP